MRAGYAGSSRFPLSSVPVALLVLVLAAATPGSGRAADTTEPFDLGATDFEMYLNYEGLGMRTLDQAISAEAVAGYGITDRLSGTLGFVASGDGYFQSGASEIAMGLYGTPLDSEHLDLDIFLGFSAQGGGLDTFVLGPSLELNWDASPDLESWGLYTRAGAGISGRDSTEGPERFIDFEVTFGAYFTVSPATQILLEFDGALANDGVDDIHQHDLDREWETGGLALGLNTVINGTMEMINQVYFDLARDGEDASLSLMTGFIATLPAGN